MPLPWTEIRDHAIKFSREWQDAGSERAEAQTRILPSANSKPRKKPRTAKTK